MKPHGPAVADIALTAFPDPRSGALGPHIAIVAIQAALLAMTFAAFLGLAVNTLFIRMLYLEKFVQHYQWLFLVAPLDAAAFIGARAYLLLNVARGISHTGWWDQPGYYPVYVVQRMATLVYYATLISSANDLLINDLLYLPTCLHASS